MAESNSYAENNAPFIFWSIKKIWGECTSYDVMTEEEINAVPNNRSGIYVFYLDSDVHRYPIYIGVTSRNFRQRFKEHYQDGVINKVISNQFPQNIPKISLPLRALIVPVRYMMQAKFMESVYLQEYDFCLNADENGRRRMVVDVSREQFPVEASKGDFDLIFGNIMKEVTDVYDTYSYQ